MITDGIFLFYNRGAFLTNTRRSPVEIANCDATVTELRLAQILKIRTLA